MECVRRGVTTDIGAFFLALRDEGQWTEQNAALLASSSQRQPVASTKKLGAARGATG